MPNSSPASKTVDAAVSDVQGALQARGLPALLWAIADKVPSEADVELVKATVN